MGGLLLVGLTSAACGHGEPALPREYRRVAVPAAVLASTEAQARGRRLFLENCSLCHGTRGDGQGERREGLATPPRNFTDRHWQSSTSPRRVYFAIREGLAGTPMPQWKSLSEQDAWDMTAFVLTLANNP